MNNEKYKDCFTEIEEGKINADFNNATVSCISSKNNKFSMDSEGNLVVNSIITKETNNLVTDFDAIYPIGSIYMSVTNTNPEILFGGSWESINGRFLLSSGTSSDGNNYEIGTTGGEVNHNLTINEMPNHNHTYDIENIVTSIGNGGAWSPCIKGTGNPALNQNTSDVGKSQPHNNMPPYLVVNIWKRVA